VARRPPNVDLSDAERTRQEFLADRRAAQPSLRRALLADARLTSERRSEPFPTSRGAMALAMIRLATVSDAYLAQALYRAKVSLQVHDIPVLPRILHRLAMMTAQVAIGDPVVVDAGVYFPHGQVVIDGITEIGADTAISPWVTVGLILGDMKGPTIGRDVRIGTGAKVLGPVVIGDGARIGANAVVLVDVPAGATAVGVPARIVPAGARAAG
jgi:serine O-acetyltransferase